MTRFTTICIVCIALVLSLNHEGHAQYRQSFRPQAMPYRPPVQRYSYQPAPIYRPMPQYNNYAPPQYHNYYASPQYGYGYAPSITPASKYAMDQQAATIKKAAAGLAAVALTAVVVGSMNYHRQRTMLENANRDLAAGQMFSVGDRVYSVQVGQRSALAGGGWYSLWTGTVDWDYGNGVYRIRIQSNDGTDPLIPGFSYNFVRGQFGR